MFPIEMPVVGGFKTAAVTRQQLASMMVSDCLGARQSQESWLPRLVFSSNGQGIALAGKDAGFKSAMDSADIIHADGMPVVLASRLARCPLPERIATTDFFHDAAEAAVRNGLKFYILGASEAQNARVVEAIRIRYQNLRIVGRHHGYFDEADDEAICAEIRSCQPDVVWVALGKPRQEHWCVRNRNRLKGVGWIKTCGGLYSFLCGDAPRAPTWLQRCGLEWFFRALHDPKRLLWRYLTTNPYALYRLIRFTAGP